MCRGWGKGEHPRILTGPLLESSPHTRAVTLAGILQSQMWYGWRFQALK